MWVAPSEDPNARYLIPGCWDRVQDWDAPCTCKTTAQELDEVEFRAALLERELQRARDDYQALISVVGDTKNGPELLAAAAKRAVQRQQAGRLRPVMSERTST